MESTPNVGLKFIFTIWLTAITTPKTVELSAAQLRPGQTQLLVIEDHKTNRHILDTQLSARGFIVTTVPSATAALAVMARHAPFAAVITDQLMPGMDGIAFARTVRQQAPFANVTLILLSSSPLSRTGTDENLFIAQISKPTKIPQLLAALSRAVSAPLAPKGEAGALLASPQSLSHRFPLVILAAKDNAVNQKVIRQLLIRLGFEADLVANGAEAVAATGRKKYDLILMDIQMPVMDGIQAMKKNPGRGPACAADRGPDRQRPVRRSRPPDRRGLRRLPEQAHSRPFARGNDRAAGSADSQSRPADPIIPAPTATRGGDIAGTIPPSPWDTSPARKRRGHPSLGSVVGLVPALRSSPARGRAQP